MPRIHIIYLSLITLIVIHRSASERPSLPPPQNVSVYCDSYGVVLRWDYPFPIQKVKFLVKVEDERDTVNSKTTEKFEMNVSSMMFNPAYNTYEGSVMTLSGDEKSAASFSERFGYNVYGVQKQVTCLLDFPEVTLSGRNNMLHLQFTNPLLLYKNATAFRNTNFKDLKYSIQTAENTSKTNCQKTQPICEKSVPFTEKRETYCVTLTGAVGQYNFKPSSKCFQEDLRTPPDLRDVLFPILGILVGLVFITCGLTLFVKKYSMMLKKKAVKMLPRALDFDPTLPDREPLKLERELVAKDVKVEPNLEQTLLDVTSGLEDQSGSQCLSSSFPLKTGGSDADNNYRLSDSEEYESNILFSGVSSDSYDCPH